MAIEATDTILEFLESRPSRFSSIEDAIAWAVNSGVLHNHASAAISIPTQLIKHEDGGYYVWRTDAAATFKYWHGWFQVSLGSLGHIYIYIYIYIIYTCNVI